MLTSNPDLLFGCSYAYQGDTVGGAVGGVGDTVGGPVGGVVGNVGRGAGDAVGGITGGVGDGKHFPSAHSTSKLADHMIQALENSVAET